MSEQLKIDVHEDEVMTIDVKKKKKNNKRKHREQKVDPEEGTSKKRIKIDLSKN